MPGIGATVYVISGDGLARTLVYDYNGDSLSTLKVDQTGSGTNTIFMPANTLSVTNEFIGVLGSGHSTRLGGATR